MRPWPADGRDPNSKTHDAHPADAHRRAAEHIGWAAFPADKHAAVATEGTLQPIRRCRRSNDTRKTQCELWLSTVL